MSNARYRSETIQDDSQWQSILGAVQCESLYLSNTWSHYKDSGGWQVQRVVVLDTNKQDRPVAAVVLQCKRKWGLRVWFVQGGLQSNQQSEDKLMEFWRCVMDEYVGDSARDIVLVNHYSDARQENQRTLLRSGLSPVTTSAGYSLFLDTMRDLPAIEKSLSSNWRHNLKRARKNEALTARWCDDQASRSEALDFMATMYQSLCQRKGFAPAVDLDRARDRILSDQQFVIVTACLDGQPIAVRVGFHARSELVDFLAASDESAKNTYANYLLFWSFIVYSQEHSLRGFECGGIDPQRNGGTYNFKKGAKGSLSQLGPTWIKHRWAWVQRAMLPAAMGWASR